MDDALSRIVFMKLYVTGKIAGVSEGPTEWHEQVRQSLERALRVHATLDMERFEQGMRQRNVPEEVIGLFKSNMWLEDDSYTVLQPRS